MYRKNSLNILLFMFIVLFCVLFIGCSSSSNEEKEPFQKKGTASLYEKVLKENQKNTDRANADKAAKDEYIRKKHLAIAEACNKKYESCIEKCQNNECEDLCLKSLETCEKRLPVEFKTLK